MLRTGTARCCVVKCPSAAVGAVRNRGPEVVVMETPFLSQVEDRWNAMRRMPSCTHARSVASRLGTTNLVIQVETREAQATITASEALRTLDIVVHRFKQESVLCEGPCPSDLDIDRRLRSLCTELSASPFA
jgi:hypothetical protein